MKNAVYFAVGAYILFRSVCAARESYMTLLSLSGLYMSNVGSWRNQMSLFIHVTQAVSRSPYSFVLPCLYPSPSLYLSLFLSLFISLAASFLAILFARAYVFKSHLPFAFRLLPFFFLRSIKLTVHSSETLARFSYAYRDTRLVNSPRAMYRAISARFIAYLSKYNVEK